MTLGRSERPSFSVSRTETDAEVLLAGFSGFGLAGLTAVDYLLDQMDFEQTGHVDAEELPTITPFENGTPRHPIRLFSQPEGNLSILLSETFIPPMAAEAFSDALFEESEGSTISEIAVLSGVPIPHGPDDHRTFYVATADYQEHRLEGSEVPPMANGFVDGVNASLLSRAIDSDLAVGLLTTPAHQQTPDVDAALRLVETARELYDLSVDTGPLEAFAADVQQYYADLAERMERNVEESERPEDRMYM